MLKEVELREETLKILNKIMKNKFAVILYTADYGCSECQILEELLRNEGLENLIDLKVIISHDAESLNLAEQFGVDTIPLIIVKNENNVLRIDDFNPLDQLEKLRQVIKHRIELYNDLKKRYEEHSVGLSKSLGKEVVVNHKVIPLIIKSIEEFGKPYCPCRVEKNEKTICPCHYHVEEIQKYGRCRCGLFQLKQS